MGKQVQPPLRSGQGRHLLRVVQDGATPEEMSRAAGQRPGPVLAIIGGLFGRRYRKEIAPVWATSGSF